MRQHHLMVYGTCLNKKEAGASACFCFLIVPDVRSPSFMLLLPRTLSHLLCLAGLNALKPWAKTNPSVAFIIIKCVRVGAGCTCHGTHVEVRGQLCGISSFLPIWHGFHGLSPGHQACAASAFAHRAIWWSLKLLYTNTKYLVTALRKIIVTRYISTSGASWVVFLCLGL